MNMYRYMFVSICSYALCYICVVCVYTCIFVCTYTYVHIYICTCIHIYIHLHNIPIRINTPAPPLKSVSPRTLPKFLERRTKTVYIYIYIYTTFSNSGEIGYSTLGWHFCTGSEPFNWDRRPLQSWAHPIFGIAPRCLIFSLTGVRRCS